MEQLAAEAGLTKPVLYSYFRDKAGLADALADRFIDTLQGALFGAIANVEAPRDVVRATIESFIDFVEAEPELYRFLVLGTAGTDRGIARQRLVLEIGNRISLVVGAGLRRAGADSGAAELWSFSILGAVFIGAEWWLERPTMSRYDLVDYLTELLWSGLAGVGLADLDGPLLPPELAAQLAPSPPSPDEGADK